MTCTKLAQVTIGNGVTTIGEYAFQDCLSLKSINIPNNVTSIGRGAFLRCSKLAQVTIGSGVINVTESAFDRCSKLTAINVVSNNANFSSENGVLYNKDKTVLIAYPEGKTNVSFTMPDSVITIGEWALQDCINLTSVGIPNSVKTIQENAFNNCTKLAQVTIGSSVTTIDEGAFDKCAKLAQVSFAGLIAQDNFSPANTFPGDLRAKYLAGGIGTYKKRGNAWTKQ